jgi:excisionase family DNA binding protein
MDAVIRPDQVQLRLKCSRSMVYKLLENNELEGFKLGNSWRIFEKSLEEYVKRSRNSHKKHR